MVNLKRILMENKEGIIVGGIIAYFLAPYITPDVMALNSIFSTQGIVGDVTLTLKYRWVVTILGMIVGGYIDSQLKEGFLRRFLK